MKLTTVFCVMLVVLTNCSLSAVMAPWYWVGFPVQLNRDYPNSPEQLIGSHYTFIFDTYHYENGKRYPAGKIMQTNSTIIHWYVSLTPLRKGALVSDNAKVIATMEPTPSNLQMLGLPKDTTTIIITAIGTQEDWSKLWMEDREQMRKEFQEGPDGKKKVRKRWLVS